MLKHDEARNQYEVGRTLLLSGQVEAAVVAFQQSVLCEPHFKALELLGECLSQLKRYTEAIVPLAAATALNRQVRAPALLAEVFLNLGDRRTAAEMAQLALERDPNNRLAKAVWEQTASELDC